MKKTLALLILLLVTSGSIWYVQRGAGRQELTTQLVNEQATSSVPSNILNTTSADDSRNAVLEAEALEIVSRPILVKIQISDSSRKNALAKLDELIKLIKDKYDYANAWYDLGAYRMIIGDYDGAVDAYKFVPLIKPGDYVGYANLGDIYTNYIKNYPLAEENFLKAIQNNSAYISAYAELANLYENNFDDGRKKSENLLLLGINSNPQDLYLKIKLAEFYERSGRKSEALGLFRQILSADPNNKSVEDGIIRLSQ